MESLGGQIADLPLPPKLNVIKPVSPPLKGLKQPVKNTQKIKKRQVIPKIECKAGNCILFIILVPSND